MYLTRARRDAVWLYAAVPAMLAALAPILWSSGHAAFGATVIDRTSFRVARLGSADLTLGFVLDRTSLGLSLVVLFIVAGALARAASQKLGKTDARELAPHEILFIGSFALASALADGFFGATLFAGGAAVLASLRDRGPVTGFRFGSVALLPIGAALLFWSLGGQWLDDRQFFSDFRARFVVTDPSGERGEPMREARSDGFLTIVSHPGADVYLGVATEAQLARSNPLGQTPLVRVPVPSGLQKVVIVPGEGATIAGEGVEAALVDTINVRPGQETVVALSGSTLTYHEISAQLDAAGAFVRKESEIGAVPGAPRAGMPPPEAVVRPPLPARRLGSLRVGDVASAVVGLLVVLSALGVGRSLFGSFLVQVVTLGAASRLSPMIDVGVGHWLAVLVLLGLAGFAAWKLEPVRAAAAGGGLAVLGFNGVAGAIFLCACFLVMVATTAAKPKAKQKTKKEKQKEKDVSEVEAPSGPRWLLVALGYPLPIFGLVLPAACVAVSGFERSFALGVLICAATTIAWAAFVWSTLREPPAFSNGRMIAAAVVPVLLTLLVRPYVIDGALGKVAFGLMLGVWAVVAAVARLALFASSARKAPAKEVA